MFDDHRSYYFSAGELSSPNLTTDLGRADSRAASGHRGAFGRVKWTMELLFAILTCGTSASWQSMVRRFGVIGAAMVIVFALLGSGLGYPAVTVLATVSNTIKQTAASALGFSNAPDGSSVKEQFPRSQFERITNRNW